MGAEQGTKDVIERRAGDESEQAARATEFRKRFVVDGRTYGEGFDHGPNEAGTAHEAVYVGLRPTGPAHLVGEESLRGDRYTVLTYAVPVVPADAREAEREAAREQRP